MKILVACEESQRVTIAFRDKGVEAFSCDILDCSGGRPEWHIKGDALEVANSEKWGMVIAFPPCTHLASSGAAHFAKKRADGRQQSAIDFFLAITKIEVPQMCIENPVGIMSKLYRKPDQYIQPYEYGDPSRKKTCLWLKGLHKLESTNIVEPDIVTYANGKTFSRDFSSALGRARGRKSFRSVTYPGIANAMADQWGIYA